MMSKCGKDISATILLSPNFDAIYKLLLIRRHSNMESIHNKLISKSCL